MSYAPYGQAAYGTAVYAGISGVLSVTIEGISVTEITLGLPGLRVSWDQVIPSGGEEFQDYGVYRRRAAYVNVFGQLQPAESWLRIARISPISTTQYDDYTVVSGVAYEYAVTWFGKDNEGITRESSKVAVSGETEWQDAFIHSTINSDEYVLIKGVPPATFTPRQSIEMRRARGRVTPTAFISEYEATEIAWNVKLNRHADRDVWQSLKLLQTAQRVESAVLCFRSGTQQDKHFVQITEITRNDDRGVYTVSLAMQEVFFDEAA